MADVTATQFQQDVNKASEWSNGDENTTVTMRLGQQARSPAKVINDIQNQANIAIQQAVNDFNLSPSGFDFATGGTLTSNSQTIEDASGNDWVYTLEIPEGGYVVTASTVPSEPDYKQVTFNQASNVSYSENGNVEDALNKRAPNLTLAQASSSGLIVGQYVVLTDRGLGLFKAIGKTSENGTYLVDGGAVTLSFVANNYVSDVMMGAVGGQDNTDAVKAARDVGIASKVPIKYTVPSNVNETIVFNNSGLDVEFLNEVGFTSSNLAVSPIVRLGGSQPTAMKIKALKTIRPQPTNTATDNRGIEFHSMNSCEITLPQSRHSRYNLVFNPPSDGFAYNNIYNFLAVAGEYNLWFPDNLGGGYANENKFFGGRGLTSAETIHNLHIDSGDNNHNTFYSPSLEGAGEAAIYCNDTYNVFIQPRTEGTWSVDDIVFDVSSRYNFLMASSLFTTVKDDGDTNQFITGVDGWQVSSGLDNRDVFNVRRTGANTTQTPVIRVEDGKDSTGDSLGIEVVSGRDTENGYIIKGVRKSDGLMRFGVTSNGQLFAHQSVEISRSDFNFEPLKMGDNWLWVDSLNRLRIKSGSAPTAENDGVVVGTQS